MDHILLWLPVYTKSSAEVAEEYVESSQSLQKLDLCYGIMSYVLPALSRNTSDTKLIINTKSVRFASVGFPRTFDLHADPPKATNDEGRRIR